jgi:outer membrane protein TolC
MNTKLAVVAWAAALCTAAVGVAPGGEVVELDIERCVARALEVNAAVIQSAYDLERANGGVIVATSSVLPSVTVQSTHERYQEVRPRQVGDRVVESDEGYNASLSIRETVSVGGVMGIFESVSYRGASRYDLKFIKQDVTYLAKEKYLAAIRAKYLLKVREEALDLSNRRLEKAEAMVEVGSAVRSDVLRAEVEVSRNELELISAQNAVRLADTDLKHFLRVDDNADLELLEDLDLSEMAITLEEALEEAMEIRPDVRSADAALAAAGHGVWRERGGWFPMLSFSWSDRFSSDEFPDRVGRFLDESEWSWFLTVSWEVFDGLQTYGNVRQAKAARQSALEALLQTRRDAALEVRQAYYNVEEAQQRVKVSEETVSLAEEESRLAEERYRLGGGTMLEQIDSQVSLSEARTARIEAVYDYLLSQAELQRAMGKD